MGLRNTSREWGSLAKTLHWSMAALILAQIPLGWSAESWRLSPTKLDLFVWHKSLGMLILALAALRILWRVTNPRPLPISDTNRWQRRLAAGNHALLYGLMLFLPLSGWIVSSAANIPFKLFWLLPVPDLVAPDKGLRHAAGLAHLAAFWVLSAGLVLHVGAAWRHHRVRHDGVLKAIWFARG